MPNLLCWNSEYIPSILKWKNIDFEKVGDLFRLKDYSSHALLIDINKIFSQRPKFEPVDRTRHTQSPYQQHIPRPWNIPTQQWTLDEALSRRVHNLALLDSKINLFWSGGIDSTTAVTALLKNLPDLSQLRILYSPFSTYEHPAYLDFLKGFAKVELADVSGENYLDDHYDGIFITGDGGDELNASLDESFFERYGYNGLHGGWKDFFYIHNGSSDFVEQCQLYFLSAGRPIETVLEARWWFYTSCKQRSILNTRLPWFFNRKKFSFTDLIGFYDCDEYENYIFWNIQHIIHRDGYHTWKQPLKNYCHRFDGLDDWCKNKTKTLSTQMTTYIAKKIALNDHGWIAMLDDSTRICTPSLPVLTRKEFFNQHADLLDRIFNAPDTV
jgi:hypothetical protein